MPQFCKDAMDVVTGIGSELVANRLDFFYWVRRCHKIPAIAPGVQMVAGINPDSRQMSPIRR